MYLTRQDHIDRRVVRVEPCYAHRQFRHGEIMVLFTNEEWVCSSGHCSDHDLLPNLRAPQLDPVAWVRENAEKLGRQLSTGLCKPHENGDKSWGMEGHLWEDGPNKTQTLCLPRAYEGVL